MKVLATHSIFLVVCIMASAQSFLSYRESAPGFRLDEEIEKKILQSPNTEKILQVNNIETFTNKSGEDEFPFRILAFEISIELKEGWEAVWHGKKIIAKKAEEKTWENAQFIESHLIEDIRALRRMTNEEIQGLIKISKTKK